VLLHFKDNVQRRGNLKALTGNAQRLIDGRHAAFLELHVEDRACNLDYVTDVVWH
jgi:hypothetical protein